MSTTRRTPGPSPASCADAQGAVRLNRAAGEYHGRPAHRAVPVRQNLAHRRPAGPVQDHRDRATTVVFEQVQHRPGEIRVGEHRRRHQQPAADWRQAGVGKPRRRARSYLDQRSAPAPAVTISPDGARARAGALASVLHVHRRGQVIAALRAPGFSRLLTTRLLGQFGDGVFQASLAGAVLFNPERQAHAADVAAGFAVLLLPYSVIGPFAGVFLDRWRRRRTLIVANVVRAAVVVRGRDRDRRRPHRRRLLRHRPGRRLDQPLHPVRAQRRTPARRRTGDLVTANASVHHGRRARHHRRRCGSDRGPGAVRWWQRRLRRHRDCGGRAIPAGRRSRATVRAGRTRPGRGGARRGRLGARRGWQVLSPAAATCAAANRPPAPCSPSPSNASAPA